jgi:hypothetical protein
VPTLKGWRFPSEELWGVRRDPARVASLPGFSFAKGRAGLFPPPALGEGCHRSLARRLMAVRRCAVLVVAVEQCPRPGCPYGCRVDLQAPGINFTLIESAAVGQVIGA